MLVLRAPHPRYFQPSSFFLEAYYPRLCAVTGFELQRHTRDLIVRVAENIPFRHLEHLPSCPPATSALFWLWRRFVNQCDTFTRSEIYVQGPVPLCTTSADLEISESVFDITAILQAIIPTLVCGTTQCATGTDRFTVDMDTVNSTQRLTQLRELMRNHKVDIYSM